ncbi:MAG: hypothetical protein WCL39_07325, partial [Armatimonadota bacterium]
GAIQIDANGEKFLTGTVSGVGTAPLIAPLTMNGRAFIGQFGVPATGLLCKITGKVSNLGSESFFVYDGSSDTGIKVVVPAGVTLPGSLVEGSYVVVTGCAGRDTGPVPALRIRTIDDLTIE